MTDSPVFLWLQSPTLEYRPCWGFESRSQQLAVRRTDSQITQNVEWSTFFRTGTQYLGNNRCKMKAKTHKIKEKLLQTKVVQPRLSMVVSTVVVATNTKLQHYKTKNRRWEFDYLPISFHTIKFLQAKTETMPVTGNKWGTGNNKTVIPVGCTHGTTVYVSISIFAKRNNRKN
jgi:hypothetical protein